MTTSQLYPRYAFLQTMTSFKISGSFSSFFKTRSIMIKKYSYVVCYAGGKLNHVTNINRTQSAVLPCHKRSHARPKSKLTPDDELG